MTRFSVLSLCLATAACGATTPPVQSTRSTTSLMRGGGNEVRLRCGSESLRARLRDGKVFAQVDSGDTKVLVPVDDPRAKSGRAYSDGKLTLYQAPSAQSWTLAKGGAADDCRPESTAP